MSRPNTDPQAYLSRFGSEPANGFLEFWASEQIREALPTAFRVHGVARIVEIQYMLDIYDATSFRPDSNLLAFAVTSDGHDLLIDVRDPAAELLQDEFGLVYSLGVSVADITLP